jgi:hypothetical protein
MTRPQAPASSESEAGQTTTEMLMMMGLLTAMLISATGIIVPTMRWVVERLVKHMVVFVSSP